MTASQLFWTYAFLTLAAIVGLLVAAARLARGRRAATHRRFVLIAAAAAMLFVVAYLGKVAWLGREDKSEWSALVLAFLYVHESLVVVMLVTGALATRIGRRIFPAFAGGSTAEPEAASRRRHARLGYACVVSAILAFATGCVVYAGILSR